MSDSPDIIRLKNVSPYGDVDVPDVATIVEADGILEVTDPAIAANLVESGHFALADKKATLEEPAPVEVPAVEAPQPAVPAENISQPAPEETTK